MATSPYPERIRWQQLCRAMREGDWQRRHYFDRLTGEVRLVTERQRQQLQDIYDRVGEQDAEAAIVDDGLRRAHEVEMDDDRFVKVPALRPIEIEQLQDDFAAAADPALQPLLWRALDSGDSRAFARLLSLDSEAEQGWHNFRNSWIEQRVRVWLDGLPPLA